MPYYGEVYKSNLISNPIKSHKVTRYLYNGILL